MKILDVLSKKKEDESIEHEINPVYDTAKDCLKNLVYAGCPEAVLLNNELHFAENKKALSSMNKGTALFQELRYRFVNREIEKSGYKNILDIGCGYSPRGILFSGKGYHYVGADLPGAIEGIRKAAEKCDEKADYAAVDATNPQNLLEAAAGLTGPVCITTEGLLMYFPTYELNEYIKGLKAVLSAHGGCIITPDFCMNRLLKISLAAVSNKLVGDVIQKAAVNIVKDYTVPGKNEMDPSVWYSSETDEGPYQYFVSGGFDIERIPVYDEVTKINTFGHIKEAKLTQLKEACGKTYGWKLTLHRE